MAVIGAERKKMTLPENFCLSPENGHPRFSDWTTRFAPNRTVRVHRLRRYVRY